MELLQLREKEIFEALKKISRHMFVVIGGYAVNAYTLPRFSVDCDIVVKDALEGKRIGKELERINYVGSNLKGADYNKEFIRYEKGIQHNFKVSMDILIKNVTERNTIASFSADWVFENSALRLLKGRTIAEELKLRIINPDALIAMKLVSCRNTDIRDVFMLTPLAKDTKWIKEEVAKRYTFENRFSKVKSKITSSKFRDDLQGVYGYVDKNIFEKHKKAILDLEQ